MIFAKWKKLWYPERFQGSGEKAPYFEGWYYKMVSANHDTILAVIPGISLNGTDDHAFIQVVNGKEATSSYHRFPLSDFSAFGNALDIRIGENRFREDMIIVDLPGTKVHVQHHQLTPWPRYWNAPGIMGWYSFIPFMQCYHGLVSMDHLLSGEIYLEGQHFDMDGGRGYVEKDWGVSFPRCWIWLQCNHFSSSSPVSVMASLADIPWMGSSFPGFIGGILFKGKIYRFATYTGTNYTASVDDDRLHLTFTNKDCRLFIEGTQAEGTELAAPIKGEMTGKVNESIKATLNIRFYINGKKVFAGKGYPSGMEITGDVGALLSEKA